MIDYIYDMLSVTPQTQKEIRLHGRDIVYTHKVSKRVKSMRLAVYHDGSFVVTTPIRIKESVIEDFIIRKARWIIEKIEHFTKNPRLIITRHTVEEIKEYKKQAIILARLRLAYWNTFYNLTYNNITIKNTKTRWGSCSSKGNLNFSYKIVFLPQELSDYIIVHELCHLQEMNHSKDFWNLVAKTVPNHKSLRQKLKVIV